MRFGKKIGALIVSVVLCAGLCVSGAMAADGYVDVTMTVQNHQSIARECMYYTNGFRSNSNNLWYWNEDNTTKTYVDSLGTLVYDYDLERVATLRALEIAVNFDHQRPNGSDFSTAYDDCGYSYIYCGENIAVGNGTCLRTAEEMVEGFAEDNEYYAKQGHRRNMLDGQYTNIGIACVSIDDVNYWAMELSEPYGIKDTDTNPVGSDGTATGTITIPVSCINNINTTQNINIHEGKTATVSANISTSGLPDPLDLPVQLGMSWSSSDNDIATVDDSGNVSGISLGTATITGTCSLGTITYNTTVVDHQWEASNSWGMSQPSLNVTFTCADCGSSSGPYEATVSRFEENDVSATCTCGELRGYKGTVDFDGTTYTDYLQYEVVGTKLMHTYSGPVFYWSDDNSACNAVFTCEGCGQTESIACLITPTYTDRDTPSGYTAFAEFNGQKYSDSVGIVEELIPHEEETGETQDVEAAFISMADDPNIETLADETSVSDSGTTLFIFICAIGIATILAACIVIYIEYRRAKHGV